MISLESVDYDTSAPFTGHAFITQAGGGRVKMQLEAVQKLGHRRDGAERDPVGGCQPHSNFQSYLGVNFIISLFGILSSPT